MIAFIVIINILSVSSQYVLNYVVDEKSPINTLIADLSNDLQIKAPASYSLYELIPSNRNLFTINNQTGHLMTLSVLDREQMCFEQRCSCRSCAVGFQLVVNVQQTILYRVIEIKIQDRNDHSPTFDNESIMHTIYIKENVPIGYRIVLPVAHDPDEGLNSVQSYNLSGVDADDFSIEYMSVDMPYLTVQSLLNYKRISSYSLTLTASDNGHQPKPRTGSTQLNIRIVNDSIPVFLQSVYCIDVREDMLIGTTVLKVEAVSDNSDNVFYEILTESPFIIDRLTGNIQLRKLLDYEREKFYRLIIKAYENLISVYAIVQIRIMDVNDNSVSIQMKVEGNGTLQQGRNDKRILSIPENTLLGTTIAHVILNDFDSLANGNPYLQITTSQQPLPLTYKLIYQNDFQNTKLYALLLLSNIDRELKSIYDNIQLITHDSGTPTLHTRSVILLNITDVNDCTPQIQTDTSIYSINENNQAGHIIDTLSASDCDLGINAEFEFQLLNITDLLMIDSQTGQLILSQSIDFEKFPHEKHVKAIELKFYVQVQDHGLIPLSSQREVILKIHDENDNIPVFDPNQSYNWTFSKASLQPNSILGRIFAYDNDSGLEGLVHYSIRSSNPCLSLGITVHGYVYVQSQPTCSLLSSYTFELEASDNDPSNRRVTNKSLTININSNQFESNDLPRLVPLTVQRTIVDRNSIGHIAFVIDMTNNQSIQPELFLHNKDLIPFWNISSTGEVRLMSQPNSSSNTLFFNIVDEYAGENSPIKLHIDMCNSSIKKSCTRILFDDDGKTNQILMFWIITLAVIVTLTCVFLLSATTCFFCQKQPKKLFHNQQVFLKSNDDYQSEQTFKTSTNSTIRDDDRDSACIANTNSSSLSSLGLPMPISTWYQNRYANSNCPQYEPSTYYYDLKLAEIIRNNQCPPCVYLNSGRCQSSSSDYGFASSNASPSSISYLSAKLNESNARGTEWNLEMDVDQLSPTQPKKTCFMSTHECVV